MIIAAFIAFIVGVLFLLCPITMWKLICRWSTKKEEPSDQYFLYSFIGACLCIAFGLICVLLYFLW